MLVKIKIKQKNNTSEYSIVIWIQRNKALDVDLEQLLKFFEKQIASKKVRHIYPYYKITSDNPAMMLSLMSSIQELIPEIFFNDENDIEIK